MKDISRSLRPGPGFAIIFIMLILMAACNSSGPGGPLPETNSYRIEGVLVNNINADPVVGDTARIAVLAQRNDSLLTTATVTFGGTTLVFDRPTFAFDSVYSFNFGPTSLVEAGAYALGLVDSSRFGDTLIWVQPDTFRVDFYTGDSTIDNAGGEEVQVTWTASMNAEGYIVAVVLEDSVNTGYGYSSYVTSQTTSATIPPDAFRLSTGIGGEPDTGWYQIFIYAYTGIPDSAFSDPLLPVPMPSQLTGDNIDEDNLTGRIGAIVTTKRVRSHVALE